MKIYQLTFFNGKVAICSMLYTSKRKAMHDVSYFSNGRFTDIWLMVYVPNEECPGSLKIESNEMVWEK